MTLAELLQGIADAPSAVTVGGLAENSRQVESGDVFMAVRGATADGHEFAADAVARGAVAVLAEHAVDGLPVHVPVIVVDDLQRRRGTLAARFYGEPGAALRCVGVTG